MGGRYGVFIEGGVCDSSLVEDVVEPSVRWHGAVTVWCVLVCGGVFSEPLQESHHVRSLASMHRIIWTGINNINFVHCCFWS